MNMLLPGKEKLHIFITSNLIVFKILDMSGMESNSVDLILTDLSYGVAFCFQAACLSIILFPAT